MKPLTPGELDADGKELPREGMMFVGDQGKILASFHGANPRIIPEKRMMELTGSGKAPKEETTRNERAWIEPLKREASPPAPS